MFFFLSFSLLVHDNMNLQELFPENVQNNLEILNGNMFFHYNRKLCYNKIKSFESKVKMDNKSKNDISDSSNGDQMPCKKLPHSFALQKKYGLHKLWRIWCSNNFIVIVGVLTRVNEDAPYYISLSGATTTYR